MTRTVLWALEAAFPVIDVEIDRHAQFSGPLTGGRLEAIVAGACAPLPFDYQRARRT